MRESVCANFHTVYDRTRLCITERAWAFYKLKFILAFILHTNMASPGSGTEAEDEFIDTLLGVSTESPMHVDSGLLADEIRHLESILTPKASASGSGSADKPEKICQGRSENGPSKRNKTGDYRCEKCKRLFRDRFNLKRHMKTVTCRNAATSKRADNGKTSTCVFCGKLFSNSWNVEKHQRYGRCKNVEAPKRRKESESCSDNGKASKCSFCGKLFSNSWNSKQHLRNGSCKRKCCHCSRSVAGSDDLMALHLQNHMRDEYLTIPQRSENSCATSELLGKRKQLALALKSRGAAAADANLSPPMIRQSPMPRQTKSHFMSTKIKRGHQILTTLVRFKIRPAREESLDLMAFLANRKQQLTDNIKTEMKRMRNVKWYASVTVKMTKYSPEGDIRDRAQPSFNSVSQTVISYDDIPAQIDAAIFKICDNLEKFSRDGSGWRLDDILLMVQTVLRYRVVRGSCSDYVLPKRLKRKACVLSVVGAPRNSAECFKYAVLAGMFAPSDRTGNTLV